MSSTKFPIDFAARHVGWLVLEWAHFECALEMISYRILGINERQAAILFGSLAFSAKKNIAISLLQEESTKENEEIVSLIKRIESHASRNHIIHSIMAQDPHADRITFLKRDISNGLKTKRKDFSSHQLERMIEELHKLITEVFIKAGITEAMQIGYLDITHSRD